jgi:hypothetical protein
MARSCTKAVDGRDKRWDRSLMTGDPPASDPDSPHRLSAAQISSAAVSARTTA